MARPRPVRSYIFLIALASSVASVILCLVLAGHPLLLFILPILVSAGVVLLTEEKLARPLNQLTALVHSRLRRTEDGELPHTAMIELIELTEAFNLLSSHYEDKVAEIERQQNEQRAVLASMEEGVVAVDDREHVIDINDAGLRILGVSVANVRGRTMQEVLRNFELQEIVAKTLSGGDVLECEIIHRSDSARKVLLVRGTRLRDVNGVSLGVLLVLRDLTQMRHLENMRREFIANVSHELRTPITSIKGFVETLLDGALNNPDDAKRFLEIISRQVNGLNNLINDLLRLSRIEQLGEGEELPMESVPLLHIFHEAFELCMFHASQRNITIHIECDDDLQIRANTQLFGQAIVNLLNNAIAYSDEGKTILLQGFEDDTGVKIQVIDQGWGIAKEDLPRIFERFYRVDKARSRKLGGTGLGLAIVKHLVRAHNGVLSADSSPGGGSVFQIQLPAMGRQHVRVAANSH